MIKRIVAAVLCAAALPCITAAAQTTADKTVFSAPEAVDYMLRNSLELKAAEENVTYCELKRQADAGLRRRTNKTGAGGTVNSIDTMLLTGGYVDYADGVKTEIAKRTRKETEYKLVMQTENKFYSCLNADRKTEVAKAALDNARLNESIANAKAAAGVIGKIEAESFSLAVIAAENDYADAQRRRDYMYAELKQLMSYPHEKEIKLTGSFERRDMNNTALDAALAGLDKTANKLNLDAALELESRLLKEYKTLYTTSMADYSAQSYSYAKAEAEYNENVGKLRLAVREAYNTMVGTYEKLSYIDQAIALKESQADALKTSYELGLRTASDYITAVQELDALRLNLVDAEIGGVPHIKGI